MPATPDLELTLDAPDRRRQTLSAQEQQISRAMRVSELQQYRVKTRLPKTCSRLNKRRMPPLPLATVAKKLRNAEHSAEQAR